jgi:hypothetical protein
MEHSYNIYGVIGFQRFLDFFNRLGHFSLQVSDSQLSKWGVDRFFEPRPLRERD